MKKILLGFFFIGLSVIVWYFFLKKYDYQFNTTVKNTPGAIYSEISEWKNFTARYSPDDIEIINRKPFETIVQKVKIDSSSYIEMNWDLEPLNDSVTSLTVHVRSNKNGMGNRWDIVNPFATSAYIDTLKEKLTAFQYKLRNQKLYYRLTVENKVVSTPSLECVCSTSKRIAISGKAAEMVKKIDYLESYVIERDLRLNGFPFVKVKKWDRELDLIDFDFCFPVESTTGLVETMEVKISNIDSSPALKVVFNGNYRLSHIAWFELLYQAEQKKLATTGLPLEIFYNNPKTDEDPAEWRAEVYLPLEN